MKILNGKTVNKIVIDELKEKVASLKRKPGLAIVQVGEDPASIVYIKQKEKMAHEIGYHYESFKFVDSVTEEELLAKIEELNNDDAIDGILLQLPLPKRLNATKIQNAIRFDKDIDGLTELNMGRLFHDKKCLVPCTPLGIVELLERENIDVSGKHVVILGRSTLVGKPMLGLMINKNATVTLCHSKTKDIEKFTKKADILIVAIGKKHFVTREMVKKGAIVIDVGINRVDGKLYGDVDFERVADKCSYITPVPGGVGPMTVAMLAKNVYEAYQEHLSL